MKFLRCVVESLCCVLLTALSVPAVQAQLPSMSPEAAAQADGLLRVRISPGFNNAVVATTFLSVYEDMTPCVTLDVLPLRPGAYRAMVSVTGDRTDIPASARLRLTPLYITIPFSISAVARHTAEAARVRDTTQDMSDSVFSQVTLTAKDGALLTQLASEAMKAATLGRTPVPDVGAAWCGPCRILTRLMRLPVMRETMRGMYVVHVDSDDLGAELNAIGVGTWSLPVLIPIGHDGHPMRRRMPDIPDVSPVGSSDVAPAASSDLRMIQVARPVLEQFFHEARAQFARAPRLDQQRDGPPVPST